MILCDAGPLVALIDTNDARHLDCKALIPLLPTSLLTTWPSFSEAMYLLGRRHGFKQQRDLWDLVEIGAVELHPSSAAELPRMRDLMIQYQNVPMDLADASLVAAAESLDLTRIFTLDADFRIYRIKDKTPFEIVP